MFMFHGRTAAAVILSAIVPAGAAATLVNGSFESGLLGWERLGDASAQSAALGAPPTSGSQQAWLTTLFGDPGEPTYSGTAAPFEIDPFYDFISSTPAALFGTIGTPIGNPSALRQTLLIEAGSVVSFDYNFVTSDGELDGALFSFASADSAFHYDLRESMFSPQSRPIDPLGATSIGLCTHYTLSDICGQDGETGHQQFGFTVAETGLYTMAFSVFEYADHLRPSGLLLDNVRITQVAEPATAWLLLGAVAALTGSRCSRRRSIP
jgi:hypothetical protein